MCKSPSPLYCTLLLLQVQLVLLAVIVVVFVIMLVVVIIVVVCLVFTVDVSAVAQKILLQSIVSIFYIAFK